MELDPLAIVVVNYGSHQLLARNLCAVAREMPDAIIVVVDNHSTDAERTAVIALATRHGWQTVLPDANLGFGAGTNAGVEHALRTGARAFLMLNPDATIAGADLRKLRERVQSEPMTLVAPVIERIDGSIEFDGAEVRLADGIIRSARSPERLRSAPGEPWLSGACLLISAELWSRVRGFDEDYFLYWEDVDLSRKVRRAGGMLAVDRTARATHDQGGTQESVTGDRSKSTIYYYYNLRNRLLYAARHLSPPLRRRWVLASLGATREILLQGGRRQLISHPMTLLRAAWRGNRDGMRLVRASRRAVARQRRVARDTPRLSRTAASPVRPRM